MVTGCTKLSKLDFTLHNTFFLKLSLGICLQNYVISIADSVRTHLSPPDSSFLAPGVSQAGEPAGGGGGGQRRRRRGRRGEGGGARTAPQRPRGAHRRRGRLGDADGRSRRSQGSGTGTPVSAVMSVSTNIERSCYAPESNHRAIYM